MLTPNAYSVLSDGFFWPVVVEAIASGDADLLSRACRVIERMLASSDTGLVEAVEIRVVEGLAGVEERHDAVSAFKGCHLHASMRRYRGDDDSAHG